MRPAAGVALGGGALTFVALLFNAAPLLVPGVAFVLLGAAAPAWVLAAAHPITLRRELEQDRVVEGEPLVARVEVRRGPIGVPGAELYDPLAAAPVALSVPLSLIRGGTVTRVKIATRFARRGRHRLAPPRLLVHDPLGLASAWRTAATPGGADEILVLPRTEPVRWRVREGRTRRLEGVRQTEPMSATEIDGLRPYREGTPASRIYWPALARGAGLLERRLRQDGDSRPLVIVDPRGQAPDEQLDAAVRAAASLVRSLAQTGGCRILLPGDRRAATVAPDFAAWPAVHARLALVEGGPRAGTPYIDDSARLGPVFLVAARPIDRLPQALRGPAGRIDTPVYVVVPQPISLGSASPYFTVSGCSGYLVSGRRAGRDSTRAPIGSAA